MTRSASRWLTAAVVIAGSLSAVACGQGSAPGSPTVAAVPLVAGARIVARTRRCDGGVHPYCAQELVLRATGRRFASSAALQTAETRRLTHAGWASAIGDTVQELAAESPGQKLRLTYATDDSDLESIDLGTIARSAHIARTLARQMFAREPALSLMLEAGSSA
jgi:hypothetical protein